MFKKVWSLIFKLFSFGMFVNKTKTKRSLLFRKLLYKCKYYNKIDLTIKCYKLKLFAFVELLIKNKTLITRIKVFQKLL